MAVVVMVAACGDNKPIDQTEVVALPTTQVNELDLLVVSSNETTTEQERSSLIAALPSLVAQLPANVDLHIAVTTSDMGTSAVNGAPAPAIPGSVGGCSEVGTNGAFYHEPDVPLYATNITDATPLFYVGSAGCGFTQDLAAMRAAFVNPANAGWRRPDAALGVIVLADEEDCSALDPSLFSTDTSTLGTLQHFRCTQFGVRCDEPDMTTPGARTNCRPDLASTLVEDPSHFVDVLRAQADDPRRVAFGAIIAPSNLTIALYAPSGAATAVPAVMQSCEWTDGGDTYVAAPTFRVAYVANQMGDRGAIGSICDSDGTAAATTMGINMHRAMGDPCIEDDAPLASCTAVDQLGTTETPLPACNGETTNCFELVSDPATCPNAAHQKLVVHHTVADGSYTLLRC
jgi:hypothetical protein